MRIRVMAKHLTVGNDALARRQLWGANPYTEDSDLVAAMLHSGLFAAVAAEAAAAPGVVAFLRVLPAQSRYPSIVRHGLRSRSWGGNFHGLSFFVEKIVVMEDKDKRGSQAQQTLGALAGQQLLAVKPRSKKREEALQFVPDMTLRFNHSNEPCTKYSLSLVADRSPSELTCNRLNTHVLYVETDTDRFELSAVAPSMPQGAVDDAGEDLETEGSSSGASTSTRYRWARVVLPHQLSADTLHADAMPLPQSRLSDIVDDLAWEELEWAPSALRVRTTTYTPTAMFWQPLGPGVGESPQ
eukprot:TRINITY_DN1886_c0_g1_i3.p1 TRINITY_DN1886_c0_g1~~TRINITY_DN1886_c0_g1_i3.p1  ORF type:complete len:298 (-),score=51.13 TRINITY_DN1886_c0_g1_i3:30-923(-)